MIMTSRQQVLDNVLGLMTELAGDWEYAGDLGLGTRLLGDLSLESLDLVVLGTAVQERYGRLPFSEFLAQIGQRPAKERDVTVGELVDFVCENGAGIAPGGHS